MSTKNSSVYAEKISSVAWRNNFRKGERLLRLANKVKYEFIKAEPSNFPVTALCKVIKVSTTDYYDWLKRPAEVVCAETLRLYRRAKQLFEQNRNSLGGRKLTKQLREHGFQIDRYRVRKLITILGIVV